MKKIILTIALVYSSYTTAQVGVGTDNPRATLDITTDSFDAVTVPNGILIPRVTRIQAANITTDTSLITTPEESTLIYVNDISTGTTTGVTEKIDTKGFYYYSRLNAKWVKIVNNPDGTSNTNFSFNNGLTPTTTGDITNVQLGGNLEKRTTITTSVDNTLAISGHINNAFSVDDETFSVDGETNNVGIGTKTPQSKLQVNGDIQLSGSLNVGSTNAGNGGVAGQYLISQGSGNSPMWSDSLPGGGATPNPVVVSANNGLQSTGSNGNYTIKLGGTITDDTELVINETNGGKLLIQNGGVNAFSVGGNNLSVDNENDRVGIGTIAPSTKLDIYNGTAGAIRIADGTQGAEKVLTSNADGVGTWQNVSVNNITGVTPDKVTPFGTTDKYMNSYIELKPGKWFVYMGYLVNGATEADTRYATRLTLSSSDTVQQTNGFTFINNNRFVLAQISNGSAGAHNYGLFASGIVRVEVTTAQKLYVWDASTRLFGNITNVSLNSNGENYLFAIQAN